MERACRAGARDSLMGDQENTPGKSVPDGRPDKPLRPENQRLLAFLEALIAQPDDLGEEWWEEFRADLRRNRLKLRRTQDD